MQLKKGKLTWSERLSPEEQQEVLSVYFNTDLSYDERIRLLMDKYGLSERTIRRGVNAIRTDREEVEESTEVLDKADSRKTVDTGWAIVTWCQNATEINKGLLKNMEFLANDLGAQIHVIAGQYSNSFKEDEMWWDPNIVKYIDRASHKFGDVFVRSDININPTAIYPLSSLDQMSARESIVIGHPKQHLQVVSTLGTDKKILVSTGSISKPNYRRGKSGSKAEFAHTYGFLVLNTGSSNVVHVEASEDGTFYYDNELFKGGTLKKNEERPVYVLGDIHKKQLNPEAWAWALSRIYELNPRDVFLHDVFDGYSINHHESKYPMLKLKKAMKGDLSLNDEIREVLGLLEQLSETFPDTNFHIVPSNHDDFLDRWIDGSDWKKDIHNAAEYIDLAYMKMRTENAILVELIRRMDLPNVIAKNIDESTYIYNTELNMHGHLGPNGARGSIRNIDKLHVKSAIGHSHSPGKLTNCMQVGVLANLNQGYNKGPSNWAHSNGIVYPDGARILDFI